MESAATIIVYVTGGLFLYFAAFFTMLKRRSNKDRVSVKLLVIDIVQKRGSKGSLTYLSKFMVLDGPFAKTEGVSTIGLSPAAHNKHDYVFGWYNPKDGSMISDKELKLENVIPLFLGGLGIVCFIVAQFIHLAF